MAPKIRETMPKMPSPRLRPRREMAKSNDGKRAETFATPTDIKKKDSQEPRDSIESDITKMIASISYRDQAANPPSRRKTTVQGKTEASHGKTRNSQRKDGCCSLAQNTRGE